MTRLFSEINALGFGDINPNFEIQSSKDNPNFGSSREATTDACQSLQISEEINDSALDVPSVSEDQMDYQESLDSSQLDVDKMLGSPFSDDSVSQENPSIIESDENENDFQCKRNLIRPKKRSFVYSDTSSEGEEEDEMTIDDIEAIDDGIVEEDMDFSHSGLHQKLTEKDEQNFYVKLERKIPSVKAMISSAPASSIVDNKENLQTDYELQNSEREKRRVARKKLKTWKINKKRKEIVKRSKILLL